MSEEKANTDLISADQENQARETSILDKYLTFAISDRVFGLPISDIVEIVNIQQETVIPNVPHYVKGVINLRGGVVPLIDVNLRFGNPGREYTERTCIIVVEKDDGYIGLIVDMVYEVLDILDISGTPSQKESTNKFISGMGKTVEYGMILLLDTNAVLGESDFGLAM